MKIGICHDQLQITLKIPSQFHNTELCSHVGNDLKARFPEIRSSALGHKKNFCKRCHTLKLSTQ